MKCPFCSKNQLTSLDIDGMCSECRNKVDIDTLYNPSLGWVCPKCGRVWSPFHTECEPCNSEITK